MHSCSIRIICATSNERSEPTRHTCALAVYRPQPLSQHFSAPSSHRPRQRTHGQLKCTATMMARLYHEAQQRHTGLARRADPTASSTIAAAAVILIARLISTRTTSFDAAKYTGRLLFHIDSIIDLCYVSRSTAHQQWMRIAARAITCCTVARHRRHAHVQLSGLHHHGSSWQQSAMTRRVNPNNTHRRPLFG